MNVEKPEGQSPVHSRADSRADANSRPITPTGGPHIDATVSERSASSVHSAYSKVSQEQPSALWHTRALASKLLAPDEPLPKGRPPVVWRHGGPVAWETEDNNGWRVRLAQPLVVFASRREGDEVVTQPIFRAVSPSRENGTAEPFRTPVDQDPVATLMASNALEIRDLAENDGALLAFAMQQLDDDHMVTTKRSKGKSMEMSDAYHARLEMEYLLEEASGEESSSDAPFQYKASALKWERVGVHVRLTVTEVTFDQDDEMVSRTDIGQALIRYERLPSEFLRRFERKSFKTYVRGHNEAIRDRARMAIENRFGVSGYESGSAEVSSHNDDDVISTLPRGLPFPAGMLEALEPLQDALASDSNESRAGGATAAGALARIDTTLLDPKHIAFRRGENGMVVLKYADHPTEMPSVLTMRIAIDETAVPQDSRLTRRGAHEDRQVELVAQQVRSWHATDDVMSEPQYKPISRLESTQQALLLGVASDFKPFSRMELVGPEPQRLKSNLFRVLTEHQDYEPGRCLILDNDMNIERERRTLFLTRHGDSIRFTIFKGPSFHKLETEFEPVPLEDKVWNAKRHHPVLVALLDGVGVDEWQGEVDHQAQTWAKRHTT